MDHLEADIKSIEDLEKKLSEIKLPWEDIAPPEIREWLDVYAKSHGTSRDLLLASMLPCTGALIGNTTVKLFESWKEEGNLFIVGLAPSGAGKTPACSIGCVQPLISHLEPRTDRSILVDETSSTGLFNHFVCHHNAKKGHVPILCIDEGYSFLHKLTSTSKAASQTSLTMERLCKLYDGDYWYTVKGTQGKRVGVQSARMSMTTYTTPRRFLGEIWPKIVGCRNGLADCMLILYQERQVIELEQVDEYATAVSASHVRGLGSMYEQMFLDHHLDNPIEYCLSPSAKETFLKYCKARSVVQSSQGVAGAFQPECNAKSTKNALRLSLNIHILWHRLGKALEQSTGPTPNVISETTMNMALALHDTLLTFGGVAEACLTIKQGTSTVRMTVSEDDIKNRILTMPGPYCTGKRVYNSYSSSSRPSPKVTEKCMLQLADLSLGTHKKVQRSSYFFKSLPSTLAESDHQLGAFGISIERYKELFLEEDDLLPSSHRERMLEVHPLGAELRDYFRAEGKDLL